jgi:hypothetical protein
VTAMLYNHRCGLPLWREWCQANAARELVPVTNNLTVEDSDA